MVITHDTGRHLGCYGAPVPTPTLDRVAAAGMRLDRYFCVAAQCSPSRGAILTGRYPHRNGLMGLAHLGWELHPEERCLPHYLAEAGYDTHLFGFQHESRDATRLGYTHVSDPARDAAGVAAAVAAFLRDQRTARGERPFFAMVGLRETHRPFPTAPSAPAAGVPDFLPDLPPVRAEIAGLNELALRVDRAMGTILAALDGEGGPRGETLVLYTTDHGIAMPGAKGTCYDAGLGTALLVRWPGHIAPGSRSGSLLSNVDLLPTLLDAAGVPPGPDADLDGRSFLALLRGESYAPRRHIFFEMTWHDRYNPMRGVRTDRFKYVRNFDPEGPAVYMPSDIYRSPSGDALREPCYATRRASEQFFDLQRDPLERQNAVAEPAYQADVAALRTLVAEWMEDSADPLNRGPVPPPARQIERMLDEARRHDLTGPLTGQERALLGEGG